MVWREVKKGEDFTFGLSWISFIIGLKDYGTFVFSYIALLFTLLLVILMMISLSFNRPEQVWSPRGVGKRGLRTQETEQVA